MINGTIIYLNSVGSFEVVVDDPGLGGWFGESKEKQTPFIRIPLTVADGPCKGQSIIYNGWLSEGAFENTVTTLKKVFGFDGELRHLYDKTVTFVGMPANITTEIETFESKPRCKVKWLNPPGGGGSGFKPMEEAKLGALLKKLAPKAKAIAKTIPATAPAAKTATAAVAATVGSEPPDEDEVPM